MSASHMIGNRNSTPEASHSSLRPPSSRNAGNGHHLRASADLSNFPLSPLGSRNIRPSSEVYFSQTHQSQTQSNVDDPREKATQQWMADIEQYENTLEEMAAATLDQDFKDELSAIEQWFKVLSEAERTAALYALLQQTTQVQIRFFIQVLQQMAKNHPMSGVLSPANFDEKDAMSSRLSDAMNKLSVEGSRTSFGRPPPSPGNKRNSGLDANTINAMFPDAAAAIAKKKAEYTQQTGNAPTSNRNSAAYGDRSSLVAPTISAPAEGKENAAQPSPVPWGQRPVERPQSSSGPQPMGQFAQPPPSAGLRSPRPMQLSGNSNLQNTNINVPDHHAGGPEFPMLSPYNLNASWASMTNTPMVPNFNTQQAATQADMVANATAMKLAAMSTVNSRIALDDVRKFRRTRSNDGQGNVNQMPMSPGLSPTNVLVVNESGQLVGNGALNNQQIMALQMQHQASLSAQRSRPNSPGFAMQAGNLTAMGFASPQNNGYLAAYDGSSGMVGGMGSLNLGQFGMAHSGGHEGYISDHSDMTRGRSPRGRRGTSKPPEDPTDPSLLGDIPSWLRSLRLHKYTDNLKDIKWEDLIELDDKGLEDRGVNALGARRKMLKVFEQVQEAKAAGKL
ncbi:Flap-structured DNA-binding and RNA-binding protein [Xylographa carneopallida]|nr:Flap-structured DNA-binding and RNA-binding protein [Xylographa carneopallida]